MQLSIDGKRNVVFLADCEGSAYLLGSITNSFGNVLTMLESEFSEAAGSDSLFWLPGLLADVQGDKESSSKLVWGYNERGLCLWYANRFLERHSGELSLKGVFYPSLKEIEELRISHNLTLSPVPTDSGLSLQITNPFHVIYGILWFYAFNGYGIKRCRVCDRWFAVQKKNAQTGYCNRKYVFADCFGKEKEYPSCQAAFETIMDRCKKRYRKIYKKCWDYYGADHPITQKFMQENDILKETAKARPSGDNLRGYQQFLYISSDNLLPRYKHKKSPSP